MRRSRKLLRLLPLALVLGCGNDFTPPSLIEGLRVLAVRQGDGAITPGSTVKLSMLVADRRIIDRPDTEPPPELNVAWLAGCNNPPGRQYFACLPAIRELAAALGDGSAPPADIAGKFGMGKEFQVSIPGDILTTAPLVPHDPIHYGVSYVFFIACAGAPAFDASITDGLPVTCTGADGKAVGTSGMVVGFTTLYSYDGAPNSNPTLTALDFDGEEMPSTLFDRPATSCATDDDCAPPAGESYRHPRRCTTDTRTCAPVLGACSGDDCPEIRVTPRIDTQSVERYTDGYEVMWASYYATSGALKEDARLVVDRSAGLAGDPTTTWTIPEKRSTSRIWVTVNDQRGGATWGFFDVSVE
jgi:hypothetical protein